MNLRSIRAMGLGFFACLCALPVLAAPNAGKISGIVLDPAGTPQMGATVLVASETILAASPIRLLTNDRGRFSTDALPAGAYSIHVTLAGFLPVVEQNVQVDGQHATLIEIVLGTVFTSFEKLRRQPDQPVAQDDWTWVLRTSAATRSVLRWQDDPSIGIAQQNPGETSGAQSAHGRFELTSGADHPGSIADIADAPGTAFVYDLGIGARSQLLMAGQYSYDDASSAAGLAAEWLPYGDTGTGPVTTLLVRESQLGPLGPTFRGLRMSHDDAFQLGDKVSVRYGAEFLMAGFNGTTSALRPRGEVAVQIADGWLASAIVATDPWQDTSIPENALQSTLNTLDAFPTLLVRHGRPVFENGFHEEAAIEHALGKRADLTASVFHDLSTHTAVIGRGSSSGPDFLSDYFSQAFAYDGGSSSSTGARLVYRERITDNFKTTIVYAYAGALAPDADSSARTLREQLQTRDRHSLAADVTTAIPRVGTKVTASYKWLSGSAVSQQDPYGESVYHLDPYLSLRIRQPLPSMIPGHMEVQADIGNLLAQGYVPVASSNGYVILVPSYRYFKGGLSLQF